MRNKIAFIIALLFVLSITTAAFAKDMGQVTIPRSVKLKGEVISAGTYTFAVEKTGEGVEVQLKRDGEIVARELAITKVAEKSYDYARLAYQPLKRGGKDDPVLSRVFCSYQGTIYLLYFEKP